MKVRQFIARATLAVSAAAMGSTALAQVTTIEADPDIVRLPEQRSEVNDPLEQVYKSYGLRLLKSETSEKVMVTDVIAKGRAESAGLRPGDVIIGIEGREVSNAEGLARFLMAMEGSESATLTVERAGKTGKLLLAAEPGPNEGKAAELPGNQKNILGMTLIKDPQGRTIIESVTPESAAATAGVKAGDRLLSLDGKQAETFEKMFEHAAELLPKKEAGEEIGLRVMRDEEPLAIRVVVPQEPQRVPYEPQQYALPRTQGSANALSQQAPAGAARNGAAVQGGAAHFGANGFSGGFIGALPSAALRNGSTLNSGQPAGAVAVLHRVHGSSSSGNTAQGGGGASPGVPASPPRSFDGGGAQGTVGPGATGNVNGQSPAGGQTPANVAPGQPTAQQQGSAFFPNLPSNFEGPLPNRGFSNTASSPFIAPGSNLHQPGVGNQPIRSFGPPQMPQGVIGPGVGGAPIRSFGPPVVGGGGVGAGGPSGTPVRGFDAGGAGGAGNAGGGGAGGAGDAGGGGAPSRGFDGGGGGAAPDGGSFNVQDNVTADAQDQATQTPAGQPAASTPAAPGQQPAQQQPSNAARQRAALQPNDGTAQQNSGIPGQTGNRTDLSRQSHDGGAPVGFVAFLPAQGATGMFVHIEGMEPGQYLLAVHQFGDCGDLSHFSAGQVERMLGAVIVREDGRANLQIPIQGLELSQVVGRSVLLHRSDASDISAPVACGIAGFGHPGRAMMAMSQNGAASQGTSGDQRGSDRLRSDFPSPFSQDQNSLSPRGVPQTNSGPAGPAATPGSAAGDLNGAAQLQTQPLQPPTATDDINQSLQQSGGGAGVTP